MNDEKNNNPLDLNNLPDELFSARENAKQTQFEAGSSSSGQSSSSRKKKKKDDGSRKVYECRFCSLKFCKSQALGGHMNRHRQERETETLNQARMLVFSKDNTISTVHGLPANHLGGQPVGGFHQQMVDPTLHFAPAYPSQQVSMRLPASTQSLTVLQHQQQNSPQPYLYPSPQQPHFVSSYPSQYFPTNDYCVGHVLGATGLETTSYACIGVPAGPSGIDSTIGIRGNNGTAVVQATSNGGDHHNGKHDDGMSWGMRSRA